jgi:hypothetical protein
MIITVCSYPRSGRHKFAAKLASLQAWERDGKPITPVAVGIFEDIGPVVGYELADEQGVATADIIKRYKDKDDGRVYILATHLPPSEVPGNKIVLIRDPREVAVSYSHWWMKTTGRTEEQRQEFLSDWVCHSATRVKKKWGANISKCNWTHWHSDLQPRDVLKFEEIDAYNMWEQFQRFDVDAMRNGPEINFEWLRAGDPYMFRRGERCLDEFPDLLKEEADRRWGHLIRRFWP